MGNSLQGAKDGLPPPPKQQTVIRHAGPRHARSIAPRAELPKPPSLSTFSARARASVFLTVDEFLWRHPHHPSVSRLQGPESTLGFALGFVHSAGFDKGIFPFQDPWDGFYQEDPLLLVLSLTEVMSRVVPWILNQPRIPGVHPTGSR